MIVNYPRMRRRAKGWPDDLSTALEFVSDGGGFTVSSRVGKSWNGKIQFSNGNGWRTWNGEKISSEEYGGKQRIYLRGIGNSKISDDPDDDYEFFGLSRETSGTDLINLSCNGNIERLLDYQKVENGEHPVMEEYCFCALFYRCDLLKFAPSLPATTLANSCYSSMFEGCTGLTAAPSLPDRKSVG